MTNPTQPLDLERMRELADAQVERVRKSAKHRAVFASDFEEEFASQMEDTTISVPLPPLLPLLALLDALSSERAARVDAEGERDVAMREMRKYAREAGEAIGKLETSELAGIVEGWKERALAAEAQVSALQAQVDGLRGAGQRIDMLSSAMFDGLKGCDPAFRSRLASAFAGLRSALSQPPADEPAKGGEGA